MALNSLKIVIVMGLAALGVLKVHAGINEEMNAEYLTVAKVKVTEIRQDIFGQSVYENISEKAFTEVSELPGMPNKSGKVSTADIGKIIATGKELVALGESIYTLVQKGKPNLQTTYAPISVLPKQAGAPVDMFDTENWSAPKKRSYEIVYENLYGMDVVTFRYSVIFVYGGTYNGKGAYITAAQIIPERVDVSFGYDFAATMRLNGIQNHGTVSNPVAGAILNMQYDVKTVLKATSESETYHLMGNGSFKQL